MTYRAPRKPKAPIVGFAASTSTALAGVLATASGLFVAGTDQVAAQDLCSRYTVVRGDTLSEIASRAGVQGGVLVQAAFAQGMTVATLTGHGDLAAWARLAGVSGYLAALALAPQDALGNALAYVCGTSLCALLLWRWVWCGLGVNTRVGAGRGWRWRIS